MNKTNQKSKWKQIGIANYLTFIRIFISPIFMLVYIENDLFGIPEWILPFVLLILMSVSELSDAFDGYLARKYNQVTDFGKIFDPMADSIVRISILLTFTQPPVNIPLLLVFIFIYRDSVISTLRTVCALKGFALAARMSGKIKAVTQAISAYIILLTMIPYSFGWIEQSTLRNIGTWAVAISATYTLYSGMDYILANKEYVKKVILPRSD